MGFGRLDNRLEVTGQSVSLGITVRPERPAIISAGTGGLGPLKNKGSKKRRGRPRPKYQAPVPEHPQTESVIAPATIHANHVEAFNAALRRRNAAFRRKTNTYAKTQWDLQRTLDRHWLIHNFVRVHFTTQKVPAVAIGILEIGLAWPQLFSIRYAA